MAAIEYGSDYCCVILNGGGDGSKLASIHLHADAMKIDSGALIFTSAGRRAAGTEPEKKNGSEKKREGGGSEDAIYFALAPGSWKIVYAANLKDGSPVSVEHWEGSRDREAAVRDKAAHY